MPLDGVLTFADKLEAFAAFVFAPIPSLLMVYQFLYLRLRRGRQVGFKPKGIIETFKELGSSASAAAPPGEPETADALVKKRRDSYFALSTLFMDLLLPAILLYALSVLGFKFLLFWGSSFDASALTTQPNGGTGKSLYQNLGFYVWCGAYVAALQQLVLRVSRRDVNAGLSYRVLVNFALGLVIGALVLVLLPNEILASKEKSANENVSPFLLGLAVCFSAGFAPQAVVNTFTAIADRFWSTKAPQAAPRNDLPVSFVNGITPEIEARLAEEGITNIANLAYADPVALIKNTVYSRNQIINWMDQALLIDVMPEGWQALRRCGVSGVLDLIASKDCEDAIGEYAAAANIKPAMLKCLIKRLDEDQQVNILKALYKDPEQTGLSATGAPKPPAAGAAAPPATPPKP